MKKAVFLLSLSIVQTKHIAIVKIMLQRFSCWGIVATKVLRIVITFDLLYGYIVATIAACLVETMKMGFGGL